MDIRFLPHAAALALSFSIPATMGALERAPATPRPAVAALPPSEAAALRAVDDPRLAELRGGLRADEPPLSAAEREALATAESQAPELAAMRGGAISDRDLGLILLTIGVVIIIAILL